MIKNSCQFVVVQFFIVLLVVAAHRSVAAPGSDNIRFFNLNKEYGVSVREANQVCADDDGFMWISSKMAIVRFTRDDVRSYHLPCETERIIEVSLVYRSKTLYAYTNDGQVFRYNAIQDQFERVVNISRELRNPYIFVTNMLVDQTGKLFFSTSFGLYCFLPESGLKAVVSNRQVSFFEWKDDDHFFYVLGDVVKLLDRRDFSSADYFKLPDWQGDRIARLFYEPGENTLWIGTVDRGLFSVVKRGDRFSFESFPGIPNQPVLAIAALSDSVLLLGIDGQGLWEINKRSKRVIGVYKEDADNENSLKGNGVYDVVCDRNKRVWVCTYSGGVSFFDRASSPVKVVSHLVNNPNSLISDDVNSVLEDSKGNIWLATDNGVSRWNPRNNTWRTYFGNKQEQAQVFLALCEDGQGRIWAGSYSSGVYVIDIGTGNEVAHYSAGNAASDLASDFVFDILKDENGDMWIGGMRGSLVCYRTNEKRFRSFGEIPINVMHEYGSSKLLVGTTYCLLGFDKLTGKVETLVDGYLVYDILRRGDLVWICTSGSGLLRYNLKTTELKQFRVDDGLPSDFVKSIGYAGGYLWIGTEGGLCRLNETDNAIERFNSVLEFNHVAFNQDAHALLRDGRLIMGTNRGALLFRPEALNVTPEKGRIFLQDLAIAGQSIREIAELKPTQPIDSLREISLKYFQNTISLELIPIGVHSPGSKFSWKMEGLDRQWSKPGNSRVLSYPNIPAGTFDLRIRMLDATSTRVIGERSIRIHLIPPFWETWWFRLLVAVFAAAAGMLGFFYYINRLKKRHSDDKIRFFANTAHEIRTSLTLINGPIEELNREPNLTGKGLHYLHLATEQAHRLSGVVTQLMDFQKVDIGKEQLSFAPVNLVDLVKNRVMMFEALGKAKGVEVVFDCPADRYETAVDEPAIEKVVDNLLSNAVKYSNQQSQVVVSLRCSPARWVLEVKDSGIGISKKAQKLLFREYYRADNAVNAKIVGSGIGLLLVRNYVTLHGGRIGCESLQNHGTTFQVAVPYRKADARPVITDEAPAPAGFYPRVAADDPVPETELAGTPAMKVLIADDNDNLREFLKLSLGTGFTVCLAEDGEKAWEMLSKTMPDLIVSDIMMPKMDGFGLCEKVKSTYETSHIPVILLTALAGKAQQLKGLGLGADDYLTKPFDVTLLRQRIKTIIRNREAIRNKALKMIKADETEVVLENALNDKFLKRMVEVVRQNMANSEFSKNDFAFEMNVSPSLLYKKVKSLTDQSPTDFIKIIRLEHAAALLQTRQHTITEVSEMCGFASVGYFSTVFRKHYGKSPTQVF